MENKKIEIFPISFNDFLRLQSAFININSILEKDYYITNYINNMDNSIKPDTILEKSKLSRNFKISLMNAMFVSKSIVIKTLFNDFCLYLLEGKGGYGNAIIRVLK